MKILITEKQKTKLIEKISNQEVICDNCGWSWDLSDGGDDPFICHKCGHNNSEEDYRGKKVMVYYNLHKHTFSVTYKSKVILHADYVKLKNVEFRVRQGGKQRVRQEMSKNVHAFVIGTLVDYCEYPCDNIPEESSNKIVTYNPYKYDSFVYKDTEEPVYTAKEVDMINQKNKLFVISEIVSSRLIESEETPEPKPTKYTYTTLGLFEKGTTKRYYFNSVLPVNDPDPIDGKIKIEGASGDFIFNKGDLIINPEKNTIAITKENFELVYPKYQGVKKTEEIGITSSNIRTALEKAFPIHWKAETPIFSPGLRGIHTIGSKIGDPREDWSIMNFFDTKEEIHNLIYLKYFDDVFEGDIVDWMVKLFKKDKNFVKLLVDRQWKSIERGFKLEKDSVDKFLNKMNTNNVVYFPFGSKMDRWGGVDVIIDGVSYQIKPLSSYTDKNGVFTINTYGMRDYSGKKVDKIAFSKNDEILIFDNRNYKVVSKTMAIFNEMPQILK